MATRYELQGYIIVNQTVRGEIYYDWSLGRTIYAEWSIRHWEAYDPAKHDQP